MPKKDPETLGRADALAEGARVPAVEARRRAQVRADRGQTDLAAYWTGYADEAERLEAGRI